MINFKFEYYSIYNCPHGLSQCNLTTFRPLAPFHPYEQGLALLERHHLSLERILGKYALKNSSKRLIFLTKTGRRMEHSLNERKLKMDDVGFGKKRQDNQNTFFIKTYYLFFLKYKRTLFTNLFMPLT